MSQPSDKQEESSAHNNYNNNNKCDQNQIGQSFVGEEMKDEKNGGGDDEDTHSETYENTEEEGPQPEPKITITGTEEEDDDEDYQTEDEEDVELDDFFVKEEDINLEPILLECVSCKKEEDVVKVRKCAGCSTAFYCSDLCHKLDWMGHRKKCIQVKLHRHRKKSRSYIMKFHKEMRLEEQEDDKNGDEMPTTEPVYSPEKSNSVLEEIETQKIYRNVSNDSNPSEKGFPYNNSKYPIGSDSTTIIMVVRNVGNVESSLVQPSEIKESGEVGETIKENELGEEKEKENSYDDGESGKKTNVTGCETVGNADNNHVPDPVEKEQGEIKERNDENEKGGDKEEEKQKDEKPPSIDNDNQNTKHNNYKKNEDDDNPKANEKAASMDRNTKSDDNPKDGTTECGDPNDENEQGGDREEEKQKDEKPPSIDNEYKEPDIAHLFGLDENEEKNSAGNINEPKNQDKGGEEEIKEEDKDKKPAAIDNHEKTTKVYPETSMENIGDKSENSIHGEEDELAGTVPGVASMPGQNETIEGNLSPAKRKKSNPRVPIDLGRDQKDFRELVKRISKFTLLGNKNRKKNSRGNLKWDHEYIAKYQELKTKYKNRGFNQIMYATIHNNAWESMMEEKIKATTVEVNQDLMNRFSKIPKFVNKFSPTHKKWLQVTAPKDSDQEDHKLFYFRFDGNDAMTQLKAGKKIAIANGLGKEDIDDCIENIDNNLKDLVHSGLKAKGVIFEPEDTIIKWSLLLSEENCFQSPHKDFRDKDLKKNWFQKNVWLGFLPVTEDGMFIQFWDMDKPSEEGKICFIDQSTLVLCPSDVVHGGGFKSSDNMNPRLHFYIYLNDVKPPLHNTNNYQKHKLKNQNSPKKPIKGPREDVQYFCELFPRSSYLQRGKVEILFHLPKFGPRVEKRKASTKSTPVKKNKKAKLENANKSKRKASLTQSTPIKNKKAKSEKKK